MTHGNYPQTRTNNSTPRTTATVYTTTATATVQENRRFDPYQIYGPDINISDIEVPSVQTWTYVACPGIFRGQRAAYTDSIIVAVDGACRGNGTPSSRASCGVFFGANSVYNKQTVLPSTYATNQKAELMACIIALKRVFEIQRECFEGSLRKVVIKTDSSYLVRGMTDWIFKWKQNGFTNLRGGTVMNTALFKELEQFVLLLKAENVEILFWHVPRAYNQQADQLANNALDMAGIDGDH